MAKICTYSKMSQAPQKKGPRYGYTVESINPLTGMSEVKVFETEAAYKASPEYRAKVAANAAASAAASVSSASSGGAMRPAAGGGGAPSAASVYVNPYSYMPTAAATALPALSITTQAQTNAQYRAELAAQKAKNEYEAKMVKNGKKRTSRRRRNARKSRKQRRH
jgi:hypothetical protein